MENSHRMLNNVESYLRKINLITKGACTIDPKKIRINNNHFLNKICTSPIFKQRTLDKFQRLYAIYEDNDYYKNVIINNLKKLFANTWDGAYSELTAYDFFNLILDSPCDLQLKNISKDRTLAKYCYKSEVSEIDGFIKEALVYFEIKSLMSRLDELIIKLKSELSCYDDENCFIIQSDYVKDNIEINDDKQYAQLKAEILDAKKQRKCYIHSNIIKGLNFRLHYKRDIIVETHVCESPFEMAQRLEKRPLLHYNQFVDGMFIKVFVCTSLKTNGGLICSRDFFRALSRRVFCKLTKEDEKFDDNSDLTISFIAKHLSGLLFIVDYSTSNDKRVVSPEELYKGYLYANPNALISSKFVGFRNLAIAIDKKQMVGDIDDFAADNY